VQLHTPTIKQKIPPFRSNGW